MKDLLSRSEVVWTRLRLRGSAENDPTAQMLYALMWGMLPIFAIHATVGMLLTSREGFGLVGFVNTVLLATPVASLILLRKGLVRASGIAFLSGVWLSYTLIILFNGGIHHVGLAAYIALPVCAAWLYGYRAALWMAAACFGSATAMATLETIGVGPLHYFQGRPVGIWFILLECTVMGVVPVSMVLSNLRRALEDSQRAQAELKRTQEENLRRQKLESVGALASGIAHDFNNLLGGILAEAQLVEQEAALESEAEAGLIRIQGLASRAAEIVRELMVYAGSETTNFAPVDLSRLVEEMLGLLKVSVSKRATLKTRLERNLPRIRGQAAQLRQVVMNLIINASEALGEKDGIITVTTRLEAIEKDHASLGGTALPNGNYVRLEVADNGSGITEQQRSKIFDPFFTTKFAGRGLGLAVVHGVVRSHGGAIMLESTPGEGTTFDILLPCAAQFEGQDGRPETPAPSENKSPSTGTVLLVEDEDMLRPAVARILQKSGFAVIEAADGSGAIDLLRDAERDIDVVLLDLTIPGADSLEVAEESSRRRPQTRIVIMSAYGPEAASPFRKIPQVASFLRKPFRAADLIQTLRDAASTSAGTAGVSTHQTTGQ